MTLKRVFFWIWSTLLIGASSIFVFSPFLHTPSFSKQLLIGLTLAAVSELGFFSYLIFNWLCRGQIQNKKLYYFILTGLILVVIINFIYLSIHQTLPHHFIILGIILGVAVITSYIKSKWTNFSAFLPTLFFMIVGTIIESTPSLQIRIGQVPLIILLQTVSVLLLCNAWQILQLHGWVKNT